jgi:hypothetical protein
MSTAEKIYELVKAMPEAQAGEVLDFVEFLQHKQQHLNQKPLDFRNAAGLGKEIWQSVDVDAYLVQERSSWD